MRTAFDLYGVGTVFNRIAVVVLLLSSWDDSGVLEIDGLASSEFSLAAFKSLSSKQNAGLDTAVGKPAKNVVEVIDASDVKFVLHFRVGSGSVFVTEEASLDQGAEASVPTKGYLGTLTEDEEIRFGRFVRYSLKARNTISGKVVFIGPIRKEPLDSIEDLQDGCVVAILNRGRRIEVTNAQGPERNAVHSFNCGANRCVAARKMPGRNTAVILTRNNSGSLASAELIVWDYFSGTSRVVARYKPVSAILEAPKQKFTGDMNADAAFDGKRLETKRSPSGIANSQMEFVKRRFLDLATAMDVSENGRAVAVYAFGDLYAYDSTSWAVTFVKRHAFYVSSVFQIETPQLHLSPDGRRVVLVDRSPVPRLERFISIVGGANCDVVDDSDGYGWIKWPNYKHGAFSPDGRWYYGTTLNGRLKRVSAEEVCQAPMQNVGGVRESDYDYGPRSEMKPGSVMANRGFEVASDGIVVWSKGVLGVYSNDLTSVKVIGASDYFQLVPDRVLQRKGNPSFEAVK